MTDPILYSLETGEPMAVPCTDWAAAWCPACGTCNCRRDELGRREAGTGNGCQLHDGASAHATGANRAVTVRRVPRHRRRLRNRRQMAPDTLGALATWRPPARAILLWQIADLLRQAARQRLFWGVQDPAQFAGYLDWPVAP